MNKAEKKVNITIPFVRDPYGYVEKGERSFPIEVADHLVLIGVAEDRETKVTGPDATKKKTSSNAVTSGSLSQADRASTPTTSRRSKVRK